MTATTKEGVSNLAIRVKNGDQDAFRELEGIAKPLLISLSNQFSNYHYKFEYEDFYSIGMTSLYVACLSYNEQNPSFLDYAKLIILREFWKQIKYWNAERRNIFTNKEVAVDVLVELGLEPICEEDINESAYLAEFRGRIEGIINDSYESEKAKVLKMYFIGGNRIVDIAKDMKIDYKNAYALIQRGAKKITREYAERYLP